MPDGEFKHRTIVEQELVKARVDRAKKEYPRFDEFFEKGLKTWLSRRPLVVGTPVKGQGGMYLIRTRPWFAMRIPQMRVLYRVTENEVFIEALTLIEK